MAFDVVIRNGVVVDGTGMPPYRADVGIRGGGSRRSAASASGERPTSTPRATSSRPVSSTATPTWTAQMFWDPLGTSRAGTASPPSVMGNCGFTLAPASAEQRAARRAQPRARRGHLRRRDGRGHRVDVDDVRRVPRRRRPAAQGHQLRGQHRPLRAAHVRDGRARVHRRGDADDLAAMEPSCATRLQAGATGSPRRARDHHETSDDRPVASRLASWDEVRALVGVHGRPRAAASSSSLEDPADGADRARSARDERLLDLAVETGVPFAFGAPRCRAAHARADRRDRRCRRAHVRARRTAAASATMSSFRTQLPFDRCPSGTRAARLPARRAAHAAAATPTCGARLVHAAHHGDYGDAIGAEARKPDFDRHAGARRPLPPNPTVAEVARAARRRPRRADDRPRARDRLRAVLRADQLARSTTMRVKHVMQHPRTVMAFSDAGAHVSQISDCSIQTHLLAYWVRDRRTSRSKRRSAC